MASISSVDKMKIEKLLQMESGFVLDFTNASFRDFIYENLAIDIYNDKYSEFGNSKAKRLRCFLKKESNSVVSRMLIMFLKYFHFKGFIEDEEISRLYDECIKISSALGELEDDETQVLNIRGDQNFEVLSLAIKESIQKGQAILALDRLHTYMVKYIRRLCNKHDIQYSKDEPLNSCYGKYVKNIISKGIIESEMSKAILKSSISILDKFNYVRNNKSYAHDNNVLNNDESMFIYKSIVNMINFINLIEEKIVIDVEYEFPF
ncbi:MAG: abortive infection family protein [Clostridium sp.]|uniref:abortive infection family protein n=1 Tax=Clostridium sp. TaxID=1506 RepID=UPI003F3794E9